METQAKTNEPNPDEPLLPQDPASRKRVMAAVLLLAAAVFVAYIGMYRPVHEALSSGGALRYYTKGVVLPPVLVYLAILVVTVDVSDGQLFRINAKGKRTFNRKGWFAMAGAVVVAGAALWLWTVYLHALGFQGA